MQEISKGLLRVGIASFFLGILHFILSSISNEESEITVIHRESFFIWTRRMNKIYLTPAEQSYRLGVFIQNLRKIELQEASARTYTVGLNKFADMTSEEFAAKHMGLRIPEFDSLGAESTLITYDHNKLGVNSIDWRDLGAVNPVKDQGQCGSCYAFASTSVIESAWKIAGNKLLSLSEQQIVDCSTSFGNFGCNGGAIDSSFKYLIQMHGQMTTCDYPYDGKTTKCRFDSSKTTARIRSSTAIGKYDCKALIQGIMKAPMAVGIAAEAIQFYTGGVFSSSTCGATPNHAVSIVGYGTDKALDKDYWIVRNSWGKSWGELGYIRMDRDVQQSTGICGICTFGYGVNVSG